MQNSSQQTKPTTDLTAKHDSNQPSSQSYEDDTRQVKTVGDQSTKPSTTNSNVPKSDCLNFNIASHVVANLDSIIASMSSLKTLILDKTISSRDLFLKVMGEQLENFSKQNYITAFLGYSSSCFESMQDYQEILDQLFSSVKEALSGVDLG